jgi:hypothetical protein
MLYRIFYKPTVRICAALIVLLGNLRCSGHGKLEYMQTRVVGSITKELKWKED